MDDAGKHEHATEDEPREHDLRSTWQVVTEDGAGGFFVEYRSIFEWGGAPAHRLHRRSGAPWFEVEDERGTVLARIVAEGRHSPARPSPLRE